VGLALTEHWELMTPDESTSVEAGHYHTPTVSSGDNVSTSPPKYMYTKQVDRHPFTQNVKLPKINPLTNKSIQTHKLAALRRLAM